MANGEVVVVDGDVQPLDRRTLVRKAFSSLGASGSESGKANSEKGSGGGGGSSGGKANGNGAGARGEKASTAVASLAATPLPPSATAEGRGAAKLASIVDVASFSNNSTALATNSGRPGGGAAIGGAAIGGAAIGGAPPLSEATTDPLVARRALRWTFFSSATSRFFSCRFTAHKKKES
jgi:hypothetical protein